MQGHETGDLFQLDYNATRHINTLCKVKKVKIQHKNIHKMPLMFIVFVSFFGFGIFSWMLIKDEYNQTLRSQFNNNNNHSNKYSKKKSLVPCQRER